MNIFERLFKQPMVPTVHVDERYNRPETNGIHPICCNWEPKPGKPVYVISLHQWGVVIGIRSDLVQVRLGNGKISEYNLSDVSCTDVDEPNVASIRDDDEDKIEVGYGVVGGDKLFWIDTPHESITFRIADVERLKQAIDQVLR